MHVLLLSDAAMRTGQVEVARDLALDLQQSTVDPAMGGMLEMVLAWTALLQGRLAEASTRLDAAVALNPALRSVADPAIGLFASARGLRDGPAMLAAAGARPDLDPAWREIAPLLDAYARYWQGDQAGAADAFTAFAVSSPGSRFADDAVYAAARAKRRAGRTAEAEADLLALAGDEPAPPGIPHRLVALDARALLPDGVRRDRGLGLRTLGQRFADLLDGDGVALARAALAPSRRGRSTDQNEANAGAPAGEAGPQVRRPARRPGATTPAATTRSRVTPGDAVPSHPIGMRPERGPPARRARPGAGSARWGRRSCWRSRSVGSRDGDLARSERSSERSSKRSAPPRSLGQPHPQDDDGGNQRRRHVDRQRRAEAPGDVAQVAGRRHADRLGHHHEGRRAATRSRRSAGGRTPRRSGSPAASRCRPSHSRRGRRSRRGAAGRW